MRQQKTALLASAGPGTVAAAMAPSEDLRDQSVRPNIMGLKTGLETSSGEKLTHHQKAIPTAHLTFLNRHAHGKKLSLAAPPVLPRVPSPNLGPVTTPMKTYILFCGKAIHI